MEPRALEPRVAVRQLESVKVVEMDEEHERCADAMEVLCRERTLPSLQRVLSEFTAHFRHEEEMLDEHLYAAVAPGSSGSGALGGFSADGSARKSHFADHKRILDEIRQECDAAVVRLAEEDAAVVSECFAAKVVLEFERHADQYDGHYAERMAASIAEHVAAAPESGCGGGCGGAEAGRSCCDDPE